VALGEPGFDQTAKRVEAKTETDALDTTQGEVLYHSAIFAYRVGDGDKRWPEWIQFRTASKEGA